MKSGVRQFDPKKASIRKERRQTEKEREGYVAGVPLARVIPRELEVRVESVMVSEPRSLAAERFRRLASMLDKGNDQARVIVVTSAIPSEGKTTVAMNLALAYAADSDRKTLIVDGDLRRPTVHKWLKQPPGLGLADVLTGKVGLEHAILDLKNSNLEVLPAGPVRPDPLELLGSGEARELFHTLREHYGHIIVDTPPVVPFTDADTTARLADGVLLVARVGRTGRKAYKNAVSLVKSAPVLGVVLNEYSSSLADGKQVGGEYYAKYYDHRERG